MRQGPWFAILLIAGCSASTPEGSSGTPARAENPRLKLKEQAEEVVQAIRTEAHVKLVDRMPAKIVELAGGRESMIQLLERNAEGMKSRGAFIRSVKLEEPSGVAEAKGDLFGIVPYTLEMTVGGVRGRQKSFLIGISSDGGTSWAFVDGGQADAAKVKRLFPNFPEQLRLPEKQPIVMSN